MKIPGRRQQGKAGHAPRPARRQRHGERAAHAIAHHRRRPAGALGEEGERALEAGDVGRGVEPPLLVVRCPPVDEIGPESSGGHGAQQALLGGEVEHFPAIDQRRYDQHRAGAPDAGRAMGGAVVEQARVALAPYGRRILQRAVDRVLAIGEHPVGQPMHAPRDLAPQRLFESASAGPGFQGGDLRQQCGDGLRCLGLRGCRAGLRVRRSGLPVSPRAFGARPCHQRRAQVQRQRARPQPRKKGI